MLQQGGKPIRWQRRGEPLPASSLYHVGRGLASASPWGLSDAHSQFALSHICGFQRDSQVNGKGWKGWEAHCGWWQNEDISRVLEEIGKALATQTRRIQNWWDPVLSACGPNFERAHACAGPCARVEAHRSCQMSSLMAFHVYYWSRPLGETRVHQSQLNQQTACHGDSCLYSPCAAITGPHHSCLAFMWAPGTRVPPLKLVPSLGPKTTLLNTTEEMVTIFLKLPAY